MDSNHTFVTSLFWYSTSEQQVPNQILHLIKKTTCYKVVTMVYSIELTQCSSPSKVKMCVLIFSQYLPVHKTSSNWFLF